MNRILINGTEVIAEGIESFAPEYGLDEDSRTYTYGIGSQLTVRGEDAKELIDTFFSDCDGIKQSLPVRVYIDCCEKWFDYVVRYEGTTYCQFDCSVQFTPTRVTDSSECFNYLNNTIYWKNGFKDAFVHPQISYLNQPGAIQKVLMVFSPFVLFLVQTVNAILDVLETICEVATFTIANCEIDRPPFLDPCVIVSALVGDRKQVPSPLYREIFEYHAAQCGLTFKSSIFQQSIYRNLALFQLQYQRGRVSPISWIDDNGANKTIIQLIDDLAQTMNLDYRIFNGQLCIERKDYFDTLKVNIGDITGKDYCLTFKDDNACAYERFQYTEDAMDAAGNKTVNYYDDIIEYNAENADWKRGECITTAPFGRARFMFDGVSSQDDSIFFPDYVIDAIRAGSLQTGFLNPIALILAQFINGECSANTRVCDLIIHNDQASQLKALVLEENFNRADAKVIRKEIPGFDILNIKFYWYNYPMSFRQFEIDGTTPFAGGLYSNFHEIDNPNNGTREIYQIDNVEFPLTCEMVDAIDSAQVGVTVSTPNGVADVETVSIDFAAKTITLSGIGVKC